MVTILDGFSTTTSTNAKARYAANRRARYAADPALRKADNAKREASRSPQSRAKSDVRRVNEKQRKLDARLARPFIGCDGEGIKVRDPATGVVTSRYVLFRMGNRELYRGGARLTTPEILQFIVDDPTPDQQCERVGFFFDYDVSNILFDVPSDREGNKPSRLEHILRVDLKAARGDPNPYQFSGGYTWLTFPGFPVFGVRYTAKNELAVCRRKWGVKKGKKGEPPRQGWIAVPGSTRTIYDVGANFQTSFLIALDRWGIGREHHAAIDAMKSSRSTFAEASPEVRAYCGIECNLLAEMMTAFRDQCVACGMIPRHYNGPGKLVTAVYRQIGVMTAKRLAEITPPAVLDLSRAAYYGGRFETPWIGDLPETTEHDICSAYPAAMRDLPCLECGTWIETPPELLDREQSVFVAPVHFTHPADQFLCGLPIRSKTGRLSWPREGNGVYWSCEIRSAQRLGASIKYTGPGWRLEPGPGCVHCGVNGFVERLFAERVRVGKGTRGIPIKLMLNSCYGKKAQRVGSPTYAHPIDAGLITAMTRARLNDAIVLAGDPRRVAMIATDGIYTLNGPIEGLDRGEGLGQWEVKSFPSLFIVRPGLYWPSGDAYKPAGGYKPKTRGIGVKFLEPLIPAFETAWREWMLLGRHIGQPPPTIPVPVTAFVGIRLAARLNDASQKCQWIDRDLKMTFNWKDKRGRPGVLRDLPLALRLAALPGAADLHSKVYDTAPLPRSDALLRMILEAQPFPLDFSAPRTNDDRLPDDE
jgi:hypothetical protein